MYSTSKQRQKVVKAVMLSLALQSDAFTVLLTIPLKGLPQLQWAGQAAGHSS